jgi:D-alanyl-D-alanine carboxypeptidase
VSCTRSTKFTDVYFSKPDAIWTPDQLVAIGVSESPLFEPGAQFDYSNTNTVLLGPARPAERLRSFPGAAG